MLRLTVKSLMQFKLVNKSKYSLITGLVKDHKFVVKHLDYHSTTNTTSASLVLYGALSKSNDIYVSEPALSLLTLLSNEGKISHTHEYIDFPPVFYDKGKVCYLECKVSHYNGIVCIVDRLLNVSLWNPTLREFKRVRPKSWIDQTHRYMAVEEAGLGYDSRSDQYKVVRLYRTGNSHELKAEVHTLGTDSWRDIGFVLPDVEWQSPKLDCPVYYKGCCYWLMVPSKGGPSMVLSFDMSSEVFRAVALPNFYNRKIILGPSLRLAMWKGSVCLLCYDEKVSNLSFIRKWVMEIETLDGASGYNYSWRECKTIEYSSVRFKSILTFWKEDELLVSLSETWMGSYNVRTQSMYCFHLPEGLSVRSICSKPYIASLVSIKTDAKVIAESST